MICSSKVLATIKVDSDIDFSFEKARIGNFYTEEAYVLCKQLEFKNLLSRFEKDAVLTNSQTEYFKTLTDLTEIEAVFAQALRRCDMPEMDAGETGNGSGEMEAGCELGLSVLRDGRDDEACAGIALAFSEKEIYSQFSRRHQAGICLKTGKFYQFFRFFLHCLSVRVFATDLFSVRNHQTEMLACDGFRIIIVFERIQQIRRQKNIEIFLLPIGSQSVHTDGFFRLALFYHIVNLLDIADVKFT